MVGMGPGREAGGAKVRTGSSELLGPVQICHLVPWEVFLCLSVYFQAGLGARSPGFRPLSFLRPQTITVTLAVGWGPLPSLSLESLLV